MEFNKETGKINEFIEKEGKWFNAIQYGVRRSDNLIDIDEVKDLAIKHKPQLIIAGCLLYTSPSPRDGLLSRMQYSA